MSEETEVPAPGGLTPPETMRVFSLAGPGALQLERVEVPEPSDGELLARVNVALTCATDLKMLERGHARLPVPGRLGHEWAGAVAAVGAGVYDFQPGDRIVATPTAPCGDCAYCLQGAESLCLHLFERMALGAYGEYICLPRQIVNRNAFRIPDEVSDLHAAFLEPLACAIHGADRVPLGGERTVVFLGDGPMALLFLQVASLRGAGRIVVVGRHPQRLEAARRLGADATVDASRNDPREAVEALTDGRGGDTVVECVGRPEAWEQAVTLARRGGVVLFFGGCERASEVKLDTERVHYDELTLRGAFHYTPGSVERAWERICEGLVALEPLISGELKLEELPEAFERMRRREAFKIAIRP